VEEAKDVVQDSFESWLKLQLSEVKHPKAYLAKIVTHKAIDRLKALKKRRETYPGPWLPEPIVQDRPKEQPQKDILPYALLCTLEALNPVERAVLILRESFDFDYDALADLCGITQANCRQILHRAKEKVQHPKHRSTVNPQQHQRLLEKFLQACKEEDTDELTRLLKEDIAFYSDGGGKAVAAMHPLFGMSVVTKFLIGVIRKKQQADFTYQLVMVNGQPGILLLLDGKKDTLIAFDVEGEKIRQLFFIRNPDKISL
jgi:RNA polymerase sigma-70 factor (ECF subfamily)